VVPAVTGRTTWVGNSYWSLTPSGGTFEFYRRVSAADDLSLRLRERVPVGLIV